MSAELVPIAGKGAAVTGIELPSPPPTRIYISGYQFKIVSPSVALPPVANAIKFLLNWVGPGVRTAKNILHLFKSGGSGSTSDPVFLQTVANNIMQIAGNAQLAQNVAPGWSLSGVTAHDLSGSSATATSTSVPLAGSATGTPLPPSVAVTVSWAITQAYRGGKPRSYIPGVPSSAVTVPGDSTISATYANQMDGNWTTFLQQINTTPFASTNLSLGTVSYRTGHAIRPTPVFVFYQAVHVHERLDSQRRRSGKEISFPETP